MLVVAELPHVHCVEVRYFPRLFARDVEHRRQAETVYEQPPGYERYVEFLGVVSADGAASVVEPPRHPGHKILQQGVLVPVGERVQHEFSTVEYANRDAHYLAELGVYCRTVV